MTRILFIEDEKEMAEMYRDKFQEEGFEVVLALDLAEGLQKARKEGPDLIVLDILLPDDSGLTFLKKRAKDPHLLTISVIALSNYDEPKTRQEALSLGAKDYLIKTSFTPKDLVETIKKYL